MDYTAYLVRDNRVSGFFMHLWWKWKTRSIKVAVPKGMLVRLQSGALPALRKE